MKLNAQARWVAAAWMIGIASAVQCAEPKVDTRDWKLYRNETIGFEVRHPPAWQERIAKGTMDGVTLTEKPQAGAFAKGVQFILQRGVNPKRISIQRWHAEELAKHKSAGPPSAETTLAGRPAIRMEHGGTLGQRFMLYTRLGETDILTVSIQQPSEQAQLDPLYEAVLASLRLRR